MFRLIAAGVLASFSLGMAQAEPPIFPTPKPVAAPNPSERVTLSSCKLRLRTMAIAGELTFKKNSVAPTEDALPLISALLSAAKDCAGFSLEVSGHSTDGASHAENQALAMKRARVLAALLAASGVKKADMVIIGYGDNLPLISDELAKNRRNNRASIRLLIDSPVFSPAAPIAQLASTK